jgi:hypothetical protein
MGMRAASSFGSPLDVMGYQLPAHHLMDLAISKSIISTTKYECNIGKAFAVVRLRVLIVCFPLRPEEVFVYSE